MNDRIQDFRKQVDLVEAANTELPKTKLNVVMTTEEARHLLSEVERLQRENEAMKEALEWYGDYEGNYDPEIIDKLGYLPIDIDGGEKARTALSHLKG